MLPSDGRIETTVSVVASVSTTRVTGSGGGVAHLRLGGLDGTCRWRGRERRGDGHPEGKERDLKLFHGVGRIVDSPYAKRSGFAPEPPPLSDHRPRGGRRRAAGGAGRARPRRAAAGPAGATGHPAGAAARFAGRHAARLGRRRAADVPRSGHRRARPAFRQYIVFNSPIKRLHIGTLWAEGPAWNGVGRYLVWSDIPNNVQMRWIEDDGHVTDLPQPVRQQQRQHLRLRGPPALLRARQPPRRPLRAERQGHGDRRQVRGQAPQLAQRRGRPSRRRHLVHRSRLRHPRQLRGQQGASRRPRKRSTASTPRRGQIDKVDRRASTSRTASASRPTTRSSTCADGAHLGLRRRRRDAEERQAVRPADGAGHASSGAAPTASAATPTATSGPGRGPASTCSRRRRSPSA